MNKPTNMKKHHTWICERCNETFTDHGEYIRHRGEHQIGKIEDEPVKNPAGDPSEVSVEENKAEEVVGKPRETNPLEGKSEEKFSIELKYIYEGRCGCGTPVKTLELDVGSDNLKNKSHLVIAYCLNCNKQIKERVVAKL